MRIQRIVALFAIVGLSLLFVMSAISAAHHGKAPDTVILKGSPLGGVKFEHKLHAEARGIKCETCHHAFKTQKPASAPQQASAEGHEKTAKPPMKTFLQAAFHNPRATAGTCIDCHTSENAKGKKAPVKCFECHKKSNV